MHTKEITIDQIDRVVFYNNWVHLHPKLYLCDYRDLYQLSNDLDAGAKLPKDFKFNWEHEEIYNLPALSKEEDLKEFQDYLALRQMNDWLRYSSFSKKENPPPKKSAVERVISIAAEVPSTKNSARRPHHLEVISKLLRRYINDESKGLTKAFGLGKPSGRPVKPYELPKDFNDILLDIVENGIQQKTALLSVTVRGNGQARYDSLRKQWSEHKWAALNEFFYTRCSKKKNELSEKERAKITEYWNIEPPKRLELSEDHPDDHPYY